MIENILLFLIGQLITAAAIWGGIRVDIKAIHTRIDRLETYVTEAHERIDRHLEKQR